MNYVAKHMMSTGLVTVKSRDDLNSAYKKMKENRMRHLLVVDDKNEIVGIISDRDFQRAMWPISKNKDHDEPLFRNGHIVENYMSWPIKSVSHDTPLEKVIHIMVREKISAVVISIDTTYAGIVTHEDLLKLLERLLKPTPKERLEAWAYNSPIGSVMSSLADSGI